MDRRETEERPTGGKAAASGFAQPGSGATPRLYARGKIGQVALQLGFILLLVEGIFVAEQVNQVLEATLDKAAGWREIGLLLTLSMPEVFSLALPIALLIAVYRVMLRSREDRELIVLAGIGVSTRKIIFVVVAIGFAAQLVSIGMSGFIQPRAQFLARATEFKLTYEALRGGNASARFLHLPNEVVYVPPRAGEGRERPLFMQTLRDGQPARAFSSEQARWIGPHFNNVFTLSMRDAILVDLVRSEANGASALPAVANTARVRLFEQDIDMTRLLPFIPRGQNSAEWTSAELLGAQAPPGGWTPEHVRESGLRFARGLLCLIAPLFAGLALVFTSRGTQAFALPAMCALLMALDIAAATLVKWLAAAGFSSLAICAGMMLATAALMALVAHFLLRRHHQLISPALARA